MSAATVAQPSTPVGAFASMPSNNSASITAVQSGPYTKAQFQHTMEGSRTIKSSKEIEHLLRDYPAALELYRTGKYKVKVKCDADVERVILVEKRISKVASTNQTSENQENNQTVPDINENEKEDVSQKVRSRTQSQDRAAPSVPINGNTLVPTTISSIRMTSNTQPKVEHHRTPSKDREVSVTPPQKVREQKRSQSRDNQHQGTLGKQQGKQMNYEQQKMMMPFAPNPNNPAQFWQQQQHQQQRSLQPYYSNPLLQQQQQQQARANLYMPAPFIPQQKQVCRQPYCYAPRPNIPVPYQPSQTAYPLLPPTARSIGKSSLYSNNNYSSSRSVTNTMVLPPTFRTFHSNQQCIRPFTPVFQQQVPYPVAHPWPNMSNEPISALVNPNVLPAEQQRSARNRTRSVDVSARNQSVPARSAVIQQQVASVNDHRRQQRPQIVPSAAPVAAENKDQNKETAAPAPAPAPTTTSTEKLTVRQLNEYFMQASTSGRVPYSSLPGIIQRFGIVLTENDVINAGKELEYNVNDPVSARRFVHILVKLGKITKSTQQVPRQPASPSILPEDREVKDIMTQRKTTIAQNVS